jgi:polysaccharide deacetylase 2 family uncharacterized protein YibQ
LQVPQKEIIPQIAVIIDDMGYHLQLGHQLLQLAYPLTFAFLPEAPYTPEQAETAYRAGRDILVHLPMEPKEKAWNPGRDALMVEDSAEKVRLKTVRMLAAVPHATGVNNHMGSRFTEVGAGMQVVMETLKMHSLFYIDSFTTKSSRGLATARQQGVPTARRHIFLDNVQEKEAICRQFGLLVDLAKTQGHAIGIGHPNQAMLTALTQCGQVSFRGMEMVGAHRLAR